MFTSDWLSEKERDERERDLVKRAEYVKVIDGIMMMMMVMVL
jgi:hypothetical protein